MIRDVVIFNKKYDVLKTTTVHLSYKNLKTIPENISLLVNLKKLRLHCNKIKIIHNWIGLLTNLQELNFYNNEIQTMPESIRLLINLHELDFSVNDIPTEILNSKKLKYFYHSVKNIDINIQQFINTMIDSFSYK